MVSIELKTPVFKVFHYDQNKKTVIWKDFFRTGYWESIRKELKAVAQKTKRMSWDKRKEYVQQFGLKYSKKTWWQDCMDYVLDRECRYWFWSKCEHESIVKSWPETEDSYKMDIYEQLKANWDVFKQLVIEQI